MKSLKSALVVSAALAMSVTAYAAAPAKAPAKAAPAAAAPAAAAAAAPAGADCDMHKAEATMMKDVMASGAKMEMIKMDHGTVGIITTDAKSAPVMEKAMADMDAAMKTAAEGKAKMCEQCQHKMAAVKDGKVTVSTGHSGNTWVKATSSSDVDTVKMMHSEMDAHMAAMAAGAKK